MKWIDTLNEEWIEAQKNHGLQHEFVMNKKQLQAAVNKGVDKVLGIFSKSHLSFEYNRPDSQPSLSDMTESAIDLLDFSRLDL